MEEKYLLNDNKEVRGLSKGEDAEDTVALDKGAVLALHHMHIFATKQNYKIR